MNISSTEILAHEWGVNLRSDQQAEPVEAEDNVSRSLEVVLVVYVRLLRYICGLLQEWPRLRLSRLTIGFSRESPGTAS